MENPSHQRILDFINNYANAHGNQTPTLREIESALTISLGTVHRYLNEMYLLGVICRKDKKYWIFNKEGKLIK